MNFRDHLSSVPFRLAPGAGTSSIVFGLLAACASLSAGCVGADVCRTTNLVIDFPQPIPASATVHIQVNERAFDVSCPSQAHIQQTSFGQVSVCSDKEMVLYFDSMAPDAVHTVSVSADLPNGSALFPSLTTRLGRPVMSDPDGNPGVCDLPIVILATGHTPGTAPPAGSESCAGRQGTVASFPYGTTGPVTITRLQAVDNTLFMALNHVNQGTYDVASVALPCGPPAILTSAMGTIIGGPIVASGSVFWATTDGVLSVPAVGGPEQIMAQGPLMAPVFFAATTDFLLWIDFGGAVQRLALSGGSATMIAAGWGAGAGIAADGTDAYFTVVGNAAWTAGADYGQGGLVLMTPLSGGAVMTVAANQQAPRDLVLSSTDLYWTSAGTHSGGVPSVSSGNPDGSVVRQSLSGGAPVVLASGETNPTNLHLLDAAPLYPVLYWTGGGLARGYEPREMPAAGGTAVPAQEGGNGLAFDTDRVYWWDQVLTRDNGGLFSAVVFSGPR